jgi:hypothetical protein
MRNSLTTFAPALVSRLHSRHDAHQQRQSLSRELAAFSTPSDRLELDAILARHSDEDARLVMELLAQQDNQRLMRQSR